MNSLSLADQLIEKTPYRSALLTEWELENTEWTEIQKTTLEFLYHKNNLYWTTKDRRRILVADLTDEHLQKTIKYLSRHNVDQEHDAWIYILREEQKNRNKSILYPIY